MLAPDIGAEKASDQPLAWNSGTTGSTVSSDDRPRVSRWLVRQRVQDIGAVRVHHALGISGGAGGVAQAGGGVLVERFPGEVAVGAGEPFLIGHGVAQAGLRHVGGIGQHDVALDGGELVGELFEQRHEGQVGEETPALGVIDDPDDLLGKQPRIDGVIDGADPENAVPRLQVPPGVPAERRHAVAQLDAVALEALRHLERACPDVGVIGGVDRSLDGARNHRPVAVVARGVIDHAVAQQRPVLHQSEHFVPSAGIGPVRAARFSELCA